jgi:hypothetical protein
MKDGWGRAPGPVEVRRFLEGPQPRRSELWRALGIFTEFIRGFRGLHFVGPCVTVFGSARFKEDHPYYAMAPEIGRGLAGLGFTVVRGRARHHGGGQPRRPRVPRPLDRL